MHKTRTAKRFYGLITLAALAVGFAMPSSAHAWDLICRGGGTANWIKYSNWETGNALLVHFWKGSAPAGNGLSPGQCSWPDRGMWDHEPSNLCLAGSIVGSTLFTIEQGRARADVLDPRAATIQALFNLIGDPNYYYPFNVNSDGNNCMIAD